MSRCNDHDSLTVWCACGYMNENPSRPALGALDAARSALSRAGNRLGNATRAVWSAQAVYDEAERTGDDLDIIQASLALTVAARDHARRQADYDAAEAVLVATAIEEGEL